MFLIYVKSQKGTLKKNGKSIKFIDRVNDKLMVTNEG